VDESELDDLELPFCPRCDEAGVLTRLVVEGRTFYRSLKDPHLRIPVWFLRCPGCDYRAIYGARSREMFLISEL